MAHPRNPSTANWAFLNVPYDRRYEDKFLALITAVVVSGYAPHCAIEIPERGDGRLQKIVGLLRQCPLSIHDLCRAGKTARFNMPFELGMAVALRAMTAGEAHQFVLLDGKRGRLAHTLSDLRHIDPLVHGNGALRLLAVVLDDLGSGLRPSEAEPGFRSLAAVAPKLKAEYRVKTLFTRGIFAELVNGAVEEAGQRGLLGA